MVAFAGILFTVRDDVGIGGEGLEGDLLEILAGATWAVFIIGSSRAMSATTSTIERISFLFNVFIVSAILLTPFLFVYPISASEGDVVLLILLGVFPTRGCLLSLVRGGRPGLDRHGCASLHPFGRLHIRKCPHFPR
jgi:hypothetical protein